MQADKKTIARLLNTAKGQINGIEKMVNENQYCIEISNQILASIAILKRLNMEILDAHLHSCVLNEKDEAEKLNKMNEISEVLRKAIK